MQFEQYKIKAEGVRSLCWHSDFLIDWVAGGITYHLDGEVGTEGRNYAYRFDAAVMSPSGRFAVIYERLGTKGIVLDHGKVVRELNRSYLYSNAYEYPIALFQLPDGREVIAHCPEEYCKIEIDDLVTGKRLTKSTNRRPRDYFFSRLSTNSKGTMLLVAGWVWNPKDVVAVYDIQAALKNPRTLDDQGIGILVVSDSNSASFIDDQTIAIAECLEIEEYENDDIERPIRVYESRSISTHDLISGKQVQSVEVQNEIGTFMPLDPKTIISFFEHPKIVNLETASIGYEWPELKTGKQNSSIIWGIGTIPPLALDRVHRRFAVADDEGIQVIQIKF